MTLRLTEHEDTRPRTGGRINLIDKTLIKALKATAKKTKFNAKSITYSESTCKRPGRFRGNCGNGRIRGSFPFPPKPNIHLPL